MIKFTGDRDGKTLVGLGISEGNVAKLKEGKPILVHLDEMIPGSNIDILIFYGETEQSMYQELKPMLRNVPLHKFEETQ